MMSMLPRKYHTLCCYLGILKLEEQLPLFIRVCADTDAEIRQKMSNMG